MGLRNLDSPRLEIHSGPDNLDRYFYTLCWMADYHIGHPDGEHRRAERGQVFHGTIPEKYQSCPRKLVPLQGG